MISHFSSLFHHHQQQQVSLLLSYSSKIRVALCSLEYTALHPAQHDVLFKGLGQIVSTDKGCGSDCSLM